MSEPRCHARLPRSEAGLATIAARPGLPTELESQVNEVRKGLLELRQNVVLLRDPDDPEVFYPVRARWPSVRKEADRQCPHTPHACAAHHADGD